MHLRQVYLAGSRLIFCLLCLQRSAAFSKVIMPPQYFAENGSALSSSSALSDASTAPISVGFIGCGTIAKAIATGLATQDQVSLKSVAVSSRSESKSKALQEAFPDLVTVHDNNQDVVDRSDIIFITVLPQQASSVLQGLTFDCSRHSLVSLVSTSTLDGLARDAKLPSRQVAKMICLPSVAKHQGVSLVVPMQSHNPILTEMLSSMGGFVECETEQAMNAMMAVSGLMGSMYGILRQNRDWLVDKGVPAGDASYLVGKLYWGMMQDAVENCDDPHRFDELVDEQTPGGLNEQALGNLSELGGLEAYGSVMDALLSRLEGKSDGSLPAKNER